TSLASIGAARWLLAQHPECLPLVLNLGTAPGADVESKCGRFVAETFAATHPDSNDKLRRDVAKVAALTGEHKFVFFLSPVDTRRTAPTGVTVIRLDHPILGVLASALGDRKSTRLNSSHRTISYAVFCLKKKKNSTKSANPGG